MLFVLFQKFNFTYFLLLLYIILLIFRTRFILALITILLIAPQTQKENTLLIEFYESGLFSNYSETKHFLNWLTWITIFIFLITHLIK